MNKLSGFGRLLLVRSRVQNNASYSAWINHARTEGESKPVDVEKLFIQPEVQDLLQQLTGMDLEGKVFRPRRTGIQQRSHYALMTDERLEKTIERMREEAVRFLQPVPVKEPRPDTVEILARDAEISGFDTSKFVFTDITFDATNQDRTVVVREVDGSLRTATPEEHDRMNRVYYEQPNRPVNAPPLFADPDLKNALDRDEHEFVLDWACWYYEPDDPAFIKLSHTVFERIASSGKWHVLQSTRHFAQLCFYFALNGNTPPLLNYLGGQGRVADAARLIRLQKLLHPDWRVAVGSGDSNEKIVSDFVSQNARCRDQLKDLTHFLQTGETKKQNDAKRAEEKERKRRAEAVRMAEKARVNAGNVSSSRGPLGEMSGEYAVKVLKGDAAEAAEESDRMEKNQNHQKGQQGRRRFNNRRRDDKNKKDE